MPTELIPVISAGIPSKVSANVATAQVFPNPNNALVAAVLNVPGSGRLEQRAFSIRAAGYITTAGAYNATLSLMSGSSLTPGSNTAIATTAATAVGTTTVPYRLDADLVFDSVSGKLFGNFKSQIGATFAAIAALTAGLTGLNGLTEPVFQLVFAITFSTANAGNVASLGNFSLIN